MTARDPQVTPDEVLAAWEAQYPGAPMLGYELRARYPERWFRIHSLPDGQRYARTDDETREVLHRGNTVIDALIGDNQPCIFVFGLYGEGARLPRPLLDALDALHPAMLAMIAMPDVDAQFPLQYAALRWTHGCLDPVLAAVADDVLAAPLLIGFDQRVVLAPYDGGLDIIARDRVERDVLAQELAAWRSTHPRGL